MQVKTQLIITNIALIVVFAYGVFFISEPLIQIPCAAGGLYSMFKLAKRLRA